MLGLKTVGANIVINQAKKKLLPSNKNLQWNLKFYWIKIEKCKITICISTL